VILLVDSRGCATRSRRGARCPVGTVRSRLSRGREALRRLMGVVPDITPEIIMADPPPLAARRSASRTGRRDRSPRLAAGAHSLRGPGQAGFVSPFRD